MPIRAGYLKCNGLKGDLYIRAYQKLVLICQVVVQWIEKPKLVNSFVIFVFDNVRNIAALAVLLNFDTDYMGKNITVCP